MNNPYNRAAREQWESSLMGAQFWDGVTRDVQERARNEGQGMFLRVFHACYIECFTHKRAY